jgi:hypothetical protein
MQTFIAVNCILNELVNAALRIYHNCVILMKGKNLIEFVCYQNISVNGYKPSNVNLNPITLFSNLKTKSPVHWHQLAPQLAENVILKGVPAGVENFSHWDITKTGHLSDCN